MSTPRVRRHTLRCLGACAAVGAIWPTSAHHARGNYDVTRWMSLEGTVKEVQLSSPHSWIYLDVPRPGGVPIAWTLEGTSPRRLESHGIKSGDVRSGDVIKVRCHPFRDGRNGCVLGHLTPLHGDAARGHGIERRWD